MEQELIVEVVDRRDEADGVISLTLAPRAGESLPTWTPGSHIDLVLTDGLVRQYSLIPAQGNAWAVAVLREPDSRGGSAFVHDKLYPGCTLTARGPRNNFELKEAGRYLFIGGGIGVTPLMAMIEQAERAGAKWDLVYGGRTRASMAYAEQLATKHGERVTIVPQDEQGLIDLRSWLGRADEGTMIYCCGPTPLLDAVGAMCAGNWLADALHIERFVPLEVGEPTWQEDFEVELADSNLVLTVPRDKSILQVVDEAGVDVLSSCAEGTCGTCETSIVEGTVDHRDSVLTDAEKAENQSMMICVSRAACSRLVLEL